MDAQQLRNILESCLLVAGKAMSIAQLEVLFEEDIDRPERSEIKDALVALQQEYEGRGIELVEVASGWRLQSSASMEHWVGRLLEERAPRYSRALLETLVLIAYRQPITRGEIEEVRGVAVSSNIMRTLQERDWIKEMGFKDVPGKPSLWGTTKDFLDYFNLKRLDELPTLAEARDLAEIDAALAAEVGLVDGVTDSVAANDAQGEGAEGEGLDGESTQGESEVDNSEGHDVNDLSKLDENGETITGLDDPEAEPSNVDLETGAESSDGDLESIDTEDVSLTNVHLNGEVPSLTDAQTESELNSEQSADEAPQGSELVSLAANLSRSSEPKTEPDLGALVDDFGEEVDSDDSDKVVEHDAQNSVESSTNADTDAATDTPPEAETSATELELADESVSGDESNDRPSLEAMEVSAHDLDIDEWKETDTRAPRVLDSTGSGVAAGDNTSNASSEEAASTERNQAESDLRRVIDDFAEEHRQQLEADNEQRSTRSVEMNEVASVDDPSIESVSSEGNGVALKRSSSEDTGGLSESEGWQDTDSKSDPDNDDDGQQRNSGNSGEP